jgi:CcmD family protein
METTGYLFAAYTAIWLILSVYLYSIHAREKRLRHEVERLKRLLEEKRH